MGPRPPRLPDHTSRTPRPRDRLDHRLKQRQQDKGRDRRTQLRRSTAQHLRHCHPRIHNRRHHPRPTLHLPLHPNRKRNGQTDTRRSQNGLPPPTPKRGHLPRPLPRMDRSIPPRPLHRLHPAITGPPNSKHLALTSPRRPLQHDDRRPIPRLHQPANLSPTTLPLDLRRIPRRPNRRRKNQTRLPSRHDSINLNARITRTRSTRNLPERQPLNTLQPSATTTRLLDHNRHLRTRSRRHHPDPHPRRVSNNPDGNPRRHTDHDKKRWPRLRCSHNIRSSRLPLLARRRFHPQDILENDQDKETSSAPERRPSEKRNPPTRTRNPPSHPNSAHDPAFNNHPSTTKRTLPAKPGNRTGHARRPQRQP